MGHQPIGMEEYVAEGARPLNRCLADVEACDAYVGVIAWRYGFVPTDAGAPGTPLPNGTSLGGTSITEFEFQKAVETGKPVLIFLLDPEAEWPSNQFDAVSGAGDQGKAISRLRQEVGRQFVISHFRTPEELASLVSAAVYRVEMSRQMKLESLNIEARLNQDYYRQGLADVDDSALPLIQEVITGPQEAQVLQIDIGQGLDWWISRLYLLSALAADLTTIEVLLFVAESSTFVGTVHPKIVKDQLAQADFRFRQFEELVQAGPLLPDLRSEVDRRAKLWTTHMNASGGEHINPIFVTKLELESRFAPYLITQAIDSEPGDNAALQMQRLMDWPMRFVPLTEKGHFKRVVDKQALSEQIARIFVREQVSRALSMTR